MALADTANLMVKLSLGGNFLSQIGKATSGLSKFDQKLGQTESRAFKAGQQIGTGIKNAAKIAAVGIGFLVSQIGLGLNSLIKLEQAEAQTNAVIKSTAGIAGITGTEVTRLSEKFEDMNAIIGDEVIRSGANMLLTFTNIRKQAFEPALLAVLNMNTAMGKGPEGLTATAIQVGKALNDPIKGITALRKAGVTFTEQQQKQIKDLVKQNKLYEAQQIILGELDTEFKGSFLAQGGTTAGKIAGFTDAIEDLQRALGEALLPALGNVSDALKKTLKDPAVVSGIRDFGKALAGLISPQNLAQAGRVLGDVFGAAKAAAPIIASAAGVVAGFVGTAVRLFSSLPPIVQQAAVGAFAINKLTGGIVTNLAGGLISSVLRQLVSGVVNVRGASVIVTGGAGGLPGTAGGAAGGLASLLGPAAIAAAASAAIVILAENEKANMTSTTRANAESHGAMSKFGGVGPFSTFAPSPASVLAPDRFDRGHPMPVQLMGGGAGGILFELISRQSRTDIRNRAIAAGHRNPSEVAITNTANRNQERWANAQKLATERTTTAVNNVREAVNSIPSITIRDVNIGQGRRNRYGPDAMGTGAR